MIPEHPPTDFPPVRLTEQYETPFRLAAEGLGEVNGRAVSAQSFRDVILDARLSLTEGDENDLCGVFLRQTEDRRFVAWGMSPGRRCLVGAVDGGLRPLVDGPLAPDMAFAEGLGQPHRFQVVACGPSLTFVLNWMVVTGLTVDPRYKEGLLGFFVVRSAAEGRAELAADWLQVRAVLPGQPAGGPAAA